MGCFRTLGVWEHWEVYEDWEYENIGCMRIFGRMRNWMYGSIGVYGNIVWGSGKTGIGSGEHRKVLEHWEV